MKRLALIAALAAAGCQGVSQSPIASTLPPNAAAPAHRADLLYVSAGAGPVYAFTYPQGKPAGQLTLNYGAAGMCSDKKGNVYVVAPEVYSVYIFPHAGLFPIGELNEEDQGVLPFGCASDFKTGNLAVTNFEGGVSVYKDGRGTPQQYSLKGLDEAIFCTYDEAGNLFVSGEGAGGGFTLAELPAGSQSSEAITINATIAAGTAVAWNGNDLVLESADASGKATILTVRISGSSGTVVKTTTLTAPANSSTAQFVLDGHTIVQPDNGNADVGFWAYPAGGAPTKTLPNVGSGLVGVTISR
jgi:hypothetical protein